jgi:predicted Zn-dependent protease
MVIVRAALLAFAVAACAWFALGVRQAHDINAATAITSRSPLPAIQVKHANSLLDDAATLNPDQQVNVLRAELAVDQGRYVRARQILRQVVRREVNNLQAWLVMKSASTGDLIQAQAAQYVINRLARTPGTP